MQSLPDSEQPSPICDNDMLDDDMGSVLAVALQGSDGAVQFCG